MAITPLVGSQAFSTKTITREGVTIKNCAPLTISNVLFDARCYSNVAVTFEELPGLLFDSGLSYLKDFVELDEKTIINWVEDSGHPEGL